MCKCAPPKSPFLSIAKHPLTTLLWQPMARPSIAVQILSPKAKMAEILAERPELSLLLEHTGMVLPVGEKTVEKLCLAHGIDTDLFLTLAALYSGETVIPPRDLPESALATIIRCLRNDHVYYLGEMYPAIREAILHLSAGETPGQASLVLQFFDDYFNEVKEHLSYEEQVAFPYMTSLFPSASETGNNRGSRDYSVQEYKTHHDDIEEKLNDLKHLLIRHLPAAGDQRIRRRILGLLAELERNLHIHSMIEDLILIPLVERIEKKQIPYQ